MSSGLTGVRLLLHASDVERRASTLRLLGDSGLPGAVAPVDLGGAPGTVMARGRLNLVLATFRTRLDPRFTDWLHRLRADPDINVALAPVVAMFMGVTERELRQLLAAGVDDVLVEPVSSADFSRRVLATILRPLDFFRTQDYFGPERRRSDKSVPKNRRAAEEPIRATRLTIIRDPAKGCRIASEMPVRSETIQTVVLSV